MFKIFPYTYKMNHHLKSNKIISEILLIKSKFNRLLSCHIILRNFTIQSSSNTKKYFFNSNKLHLSNTELFGNIFIYI